MKENQIREVEYEDIAVVSKVEPGYDQVLTKKALEFLHKLASKFSNRISDLLEKRQHIQKRIDNGEFPNFQGNTQEIRSKDWKVAPIPDPLIDRRVEITGPVDRKMIINGLNSGANVFMADFEDSNAPTWNNNIRGQINLQDAVNRTIRFEKSNGKLYELNENTAILMVRPRGLHLYEKGIHFKGKPIYACLVDFGLFFFHNAQKLIDQGVGPYFYLPKLQNHHEARLWNDIFEFSQKEIGIPSGTIRATVLLEHILASFQMEEILYELKDHSAGLNCGRWDYIFSFIKVFKNHPEFILPDRDQVTMETHFMDSYVKLLIKTCHNRGIHAMGGMAAQIPIKGDPSANEIALDKVRKDKEREVKRGHDGTWVAHPGLIQIAQKAFEELESKNQIDFVPDYSVSKKDLLKVPQGTISEQGIRTNITVGVIYLANWLQGNGCVPIYNLMEDAATAEISRSQLWQWVNHNVVTKKGKTVDKNYFLHLLEEEMEEIKNEIGEANFKDGQFELAASIFKEITLRDEMPEFLTEVAYTHLKR